MTILHDKNKSHNSSSPYVFPSGTSRESEHLKDEFGNERLLDFLYRVGNYFTKSVTYIEETPEIGFPKPKKTYKMRVRVSARTKGKPLNYRDD